MPRILVLISLVSLSANAAVFGPEVPLSPPTIAPAPYEQHLVAVASNGRDFLAMWLDRRSSVPAVPNAPAALYVERLDRAGRPQNLFGLKLRDAAYSASLVWTPAGYVALWSDTAEVDSMLLNEDGLPVSAPKRLASGYLVRPCRTAKRSSSFVDRSRNQTRHRCSLSTGRWYPRQLSIRRTGSRKCW